MTGGSSHADRLDLRLAVGDLALGYTEEETAEFDREETVQAIESALQRLGHTTDRIGNVRQLIKRLAQAESWDLVFNIAEGMYGIGREAQVPALLDAYGHPLHVFRPPGHESDPS